MAKIVGIDLGTCYSAIVVPEECRGDGFLNLPDHPGFAVVLDRFRRRITPSVVAEDDSGKIIVGYAAKARAGMAPEPIMFAKRSMGEDVHFKLKKQGELSAMEVSAHVLRHLKAIAEERLGEPVDEAVITVPAYFSLKAKQMTEQAAISAGLRVAQIAPEPVAAALMYCAADPRDPLRILTYDLGGGTFDVAIVEKQNGRISLDSIKASDGDRFLGGYNFDKLLALWIAQQLCEQGHNLRLNLEQPADRVIFAKLMIYAERAKIELSKSTVCEIVEPATGIVDHSGTPVSIQLELTREQFEKMILTSVDYSIQICRRACLEQAQPPIPLASFDEILMVGGSSRIPLVARKLEEEFGRKPLLVEPDLCVAIGAAMIAATLRTTRIGNCLELDPLPITTPLPTIILTGRVLAAVGCPADACKLSLRSLDGAFKKDLSAKTDGRFAFDRVSLALGQKTEFVLALTDSTGKERASHRFAVVQTAGSPASGRQAGRLLVRGTRTNFLAKPIVVVWQDGPEVLAPARTPLPFETQLVAKTSDVSGRIRLPIREDNTPLGEIIMNDIPKTLPVGSEVEVTLSLRENYEITAKAYVKALAKGESVTISLPLRPVRPLVELIREFETLTARADDALRSAPPGVLFADRKATRLKERLAACKQMMQSPAPEPSAIQDCIDEIEGLLRELTASWNPDPSRDLFDKMVKEAWELHARLIKQQPSASKDGYDKQLEAIIREAEAAYKQQNPALWKQSTDRLRSKIADLRRQMKDTPDDLPSPASLKIMLFGMLSDLEKWAKANGSFEAHKKELEEASEALKQIKTDDERAAQNLISWYQTTFLHLQNTLQAPAPEGANGGLLNPKRGR